MKGKGHRHIPPEPGTKKQREFNGSLADQDRQRDAKEKQNPTFAKAAAEVGDEHIEKKPAKKTDAPGAKKVQAELAAIGHILHKDAGRMLAIGVRFDADTEITDRMHHVVRDAFRTIGDEGAVKRIIIDSKEWPAHSVKFFETPDLPPALQIQDATIRNVVVQRVTRKNETKRVIRFDVVAPAAACGNWPQNHYRADIWFVFENLQGSLFEEAA